MCHWLWVSAGARYQGLGWTGLDWTGGWGTEAVGMAEGVRIGRASIHAEARAVTVAKAVTAASTTVQYDHSLTQSVVTASGSGRGRGEGV